MSGGWNTIESDAVSISFQVPPRLLHGLSQLISPSSTRHLLITSQGVFTYLIEKLGVKDVQFEELTTLESSELEQLGTLYGVIFLFKYPTGEKKGEQPLDGTYDEDAAINLFFAAQTIQNACGTQAIVSLLLNREKEVDIGKELREFKEFAGEFPPEVGDPGVHMWPV